jgi:hypothetical protein
MPLNRTHNVHLISESFLKASQFKLTFCIEVLQVFKFEFFQDVHAVVFSILPREGTLARTADRLQAAAEASQDFE